MDSHRRTTSPELPHVDEIENQVGTLCERNRVGLLST